MGGEWEEGGREVVRRLCYVVAKPTHVCGTRTKDGSIMREWLDQRIRILRDLRLVIQYLGQRQGQGELQDAKRPVVIGIGAAVAE